MSGDPPIDFSSINTAVHGPVRLGVLTALQAEGRMDFTSLKHRLCVADGALGMHLQKLEAIKYITCTKKFVGRRPKSTYAITADGQKALFTYLNMMQQLINSLANTNIPEPGEKEGNHGSQN